MIRLASQSAYAHVLKDGDALPELEGRLRPLTREHFRRIDRFIQLALLGSAECAQGHELEAECGLYVSSCIGPVGNNIVVQETLLKNHLLPKPFHFVNTLGSSTGYYICKNLGLRGQTLFISRRHGALQAALECAVADLELGIVKQALVGTVEECTLPLAEHRRRLGLAEGAPAWEGSHWALLEPSPTGHATAAALFESLNKGWRLQDAGAGFV